MWIVRLALSRPYTFVVVSLLIAILGGVAILRMPTDMFPEVDIPVISVIWSYGGMSPDEMEKRIVSQYERALTTTVNGIEHIESQSLTGVSVTKIFFQPGTRIEGATAEVTAISQTQLRSFPPGTQPPLVMRYSATNVPILQLALGSEKLSEARLFDLASNFLRIGLATVQGAQMPWPYGGKVRQIMVDIDPDRLAGLGLSPMDVVRAVNAQNLILPSGTMKVDAQEAAVRLNASPTAVEAFGALPVRVAGGATVYVRDVAHVRDGFAPQTSVVNVNGRRGALVQVLKSSGASTLDIVRRVRERLPAVLATMPKELEVRPLFDQSVFVRGAIGGVVREALIAAGLTGLLILLFLGSWRSTAVVVTSIPLAILASIAVLGALGQSLNLMTLGGLSLAVGILVDDATVEIENIHRNRALGKELVPAILDGAQQIAVPAFVSTLCICIVFVPVAFVTGVARSLFVPLAMAVVFAMLASYGLSRTLVPTMAQHLLRAEPVEHAPRGPLGRIHLRFNAAFEGLRHRYGVALAWVLGHRARFLAGFAIFVVGSAGLFPLLGRDFFPSVDAGQIRLHLRGPPGMRIEESEKLFARAEQVIRATLPPGDLETVLDNVGVPVSGINLALGDPSMVSSADGEILVALREDRRSSTAADVHRLRAALRRALPEATVFFLPADISTQVLNFGLSAPVDVQLVGPQPNQERNLELAREVRDRVARIPGAVDVHLAQVRGAPELRVDVDRELARLVGLSEQDVADDLLVTLSSSGQVSPNFWLDPSSGVQYLVAVQAPQHQLDSPGALLDTALAAGSGRGGQLLGNVAQVSRSAAPVNVTHRNAAPTFDVLANVEDLDLGAVADGVDRVVSEIRKQLPRGSEIAVRGQVESMRSSFQGLAFGLVFAVLLVYLLMVVNFQSWSEPLVILGALPGALAGIAWMLFATGTTLSVPALMGAIMCIGVATANSILVVTFANERHLAGASAADAALAAGLTRLRPVLMTAAAMIVGMLPMSLGLGEGGEQNAPLGRAVIGGLAFATVTTLFFVPVLYSAMGGRTARAQRLEELP